MDTRSGLLKAGTILLLVGGILQAVGAGFLLLYGTVAGAWLQQMDPDMEIGFPPFLFGLFMVMGILAVAGSVLSFLGYGRAKAGDAQGAFVRGLIGALLPPLQVVALIGAILCKVSPEGEGRPPAPPTPPNTWH